MNKKSFLTASTLALAISTATTAVYSAELEEIIVTAQKRAESLQDVPISMSALSGSTIKDNGIHSFQDLSGYVPNLEIAENAVNTIITMRGIGIGSNQSFEQSVGIYVDGVHFGKSRQVRSGLFDVEQVEVLRGPQGILFGKNTLAGAINVTTASANVGDEFSGGIDVSQESYNGQIVDAHIAGSVTDNLALRFAIRDRTRDGHIKNTMPGASTDTMATTDEQMWRLSATFEPSDDVVIKAKHTQSDYLRLGGNSVVTTFQPEANIAASNALMYAVMGTFFPQTAQLAAAGHPNDAYRDAISIGGLALAQSLGRDLDSTEEQLEGTDTQTKDTTLTVERTMANGNTFTSVTGLTSYEYDDGIDADFLPVRFIGRSDISEFESLSQEFRIASPLDAEFSYIAGAYLQSSKQEIDRLVAIDGTLGQPGFMTLATGCRTFLAIPNGGCIADVTAFDALGRVSRWEQDTEAWAVFFQGTYDISDNLSLTAGFRYTKEEK
ncbi:MAG: TonB-dependent receptor, partial [Pseudomonadota bacterium]|nr:TonB-dependent receptor [Pseudomonadota bacterium]MED6344894.1 TonB-dependent receptor [Pseudomonadota bacterium]